MMISAQAADFPQILWNNRLSRDTIAATTSATGFPPSNLANPNTSQEWRGGNALANAITAQIGDEIDALAIAKHNLGSIGASVSIEAANDSSLTWATVFSSAPVADDAPKLFDLGALANRYAVRLNISGMSDVPRIAVMYVGKRLRMERGIWVGHTPMPYGGRINSIDGLAESGDYLGSIILGEFRDSSAHFQEISPAFYRAEVWPFIQSAHLRRLPFFFQWRPATYPGEVGYARLLNNPDPVPTEPSHLIEFELEMRGAA